MRLHSMNAKSADGSHPTKCLEDKSSQYEFPGLLTVVPINIDQNEPINTKKKKIYP